MIDYIPYSEFYPVNSLILDYLDQREAFKKIFRYHFLELFDYQKQIEQLQTRTYDRDTLCRVLYEQNKEYHAGEHTFTHIDQLQQEHTLVVIGGQQTGLFLGPLYTLYKALTIAKLAHSLSIRYQKTVVPVFWMATDDHDFEEINHINVPDLQGEYRQLKIATDDNRSKIPILQRKISADIHLIFDQLKKYVPETDFSASIFDDLQKAYKESSTYPQAFGTWMQCLLRQFGLVLVDPADNRLKQLAIPLFQREIEENSPVTKAVLAQTKFLQEHGYDSQLNFHEHILNLFYHTPERETIFLKEGKFQIGEHEFSKQELLGRLDKNPGGFSPNAALRPLYQDFLFPTLAIVLGPAEISYFAQLTRAYETMGIPMPIPFPRTSITLLEPRIERLLNKYSLHTLDIFREKEKITERIIKREIPDSLFSSIETGKEVVETIWSKLHDELAGYEPNLKKPIESAKGKSLGQFEFISKKLVQSTKKRDEIVRNQTKKLLNLLLPKSKPQEREFNLLPFYIRFGDHFIKSIHSSMDIYNPSHQVISLTVKKEGDS